MHSVSSSAVYNAIGKINILPNIIEFTSAYMNVPIEIPISIDVENETVLTFVIATDINQRNDNRLFTVSVVISKDWTSYFDFNELRSNTKIQAFIDAYVLGSKKLYMTCFNGSLSTVDKYKIFAIIKG